MIAGFGTINGHVGGIQCQVAGSSGLLPAPQVTAQATAELGIHSNLCLHFQGQRYVANAAPTSGAVGGVTVSAVSSLPTAPQMPLPQAPAVPPPQPMMATATAAPKPGQGGFRKVCRTEEASPCPFPGLAPGVLHMRVKEGSKIRNLMGFAMARMQGPSGATAVEVGRGGAFGGGTGTPGSSAGLRQVVFCGSGRAVTKTITCAEIMKRKLGGLHQLTKLCYKGVREVWESQDAGGSGGGGGGEVTVHRTVPSVSILLSKDPLDPREPGYQPPETLTSLWAEREEQSPPAHTAAAKRAMLEPHAPHSSQPSAKRLCVGAGVPLRCPAD
ncbi:hypothetical protein ACEWY4_015730 [Coilia grayii]|uniref:DNA/RNA-binding protein Alba-like domain-containing protein n=1 Tax=Coilia grayii TaxID=363190 RepID=A0ABD1JPK0_9TELE